MNDCHRDYIIPNFKFKSSSILQPSLTVDEKMFCVFDQVGTVFTEGVHLNSSSEQVPVKVTMSSEELAKMEIDLFICPPEPGT